MFQKDSSDIKMSYFSILGQCISDPINNVLLVCGYRCTLSVYQILDAELFELMHQNGDYTHFYFCYRWFLLDFKRGNVSLTET